MGFGEEIKETIGKAKEGLGDLVGNDELRRDGQQDRIEANAEEVVNDVRDRVDERAADHKGSFADKVEDIKDDLTRDHR
ncbi:MAG TPA: hypothetical protein K8V15_09595 [Tessaracoccus flavescens]|uniref:CsbD family protein n=1 Tax=Tessaracoccus flavescens TaxID=399497 RepID=A0A921JRI3_9ACTN|nr:hypothetical protein [Tessaracoccus flavescens]